MAEEKMVRALLQELQNIVSDGQRFAKTFIAYTKNELTDEEFIEQCSDIFHEDQNIEKSARSFIRLIIEHLLILKYGVDTTAWNHLRQEIRTFQLNLSDCLDWDLKTRETVIINNLREIMPLIYKRGIKTYKDHEEDDSNPFPNPNLKLILKALPKDCPWTLEELVEGSINVLLLKLPTI